MGFMKRGVPHVRGDEPHFDSLVAETPSVFPTCVGMNRYWQAGEIPKLGVPHVRGDEPKSEKLKVGDTECSPRAWG